MNLEQALDAALRARYLTREIRTPVTQKRGFTARLNALGKLFPTQKQLAAALGVTPRTLQRWRDGSRKPTAASQRKIEGAHNRLISLPRTRKQLAAAPPPNSVEVAAEVRWNGYLNPKAQRSVTLGGMRLVMTRVIRAWATAGPAAAAQLFERGAAQVHKVPSIEFEGDRVTVNFPWE